MLGEWVTALGKLESSLPQVTSRNSKNREKELRTSRGFPANRERLAPCIVSASLGCSHTSSYLQPSSRRGSYSGCHMASWTCWTTPVIFVWVTPSSTAAFTTATAMVAEQTR